MNAAQRSLRGAGAQAPLFEIDNPSMVLEAVKLANDQSGDLVIRLYEATGERGEMLLTLTADELYSVDLLERRRNVMPIEGDGTV